jgi:hypothetical protein
VDGGVAAVAAVDGAAAAGAAVTVVGMGAAAAEDTNVLAFFHRINPDSDEKQEGHDFSRGLYCFAVHVRAYFINSSVPHVRYLRMRRVR